MCFTQPVVGRGLMSPFSLRKRSLGGCKSRFSQCNGNSRSTDALHSVCHVRHSTICQQNHVQSIVTAVRSSVGIRLARIWCSSSNSGPFITIPQHTTDTACAAANRLWYIHLTLARWKQSTDMSKENIKIVSLAEFVQTCSLELVRLGRLFSTVLVRKTDACG